MVDEHFSVHYTSNLIHPIGWSSHVGHEIESERSKTMIERKFCSKTDLIFMSRTKNEWKDSVDF